MSTCWIRNTEKKIKSKVKKSSNNYFIIFIAGKSKVCFILVSTLYTEIYGLFCINSWRGAWLFGDLFAKLPIEAVAAITFLAIIILASIKALRNTSAPPCAIVVGNTEDYFDTPTYFNQIVRNILYFAILIVQRIRKNFKIN